MSIIDGPSFTEASMEPVWRYTHLSHKQCHLVDFGQGIGALKIAQLVCLHKKLLSEKHDIRRVEGLQSQTSVDMYQCVLSKT